MARTHYDTGLRMTTVQIILGFLYLPCYLVFTSCFIQLAASFLGLTLSDLTLNVLYFSVNLVFVLLTYHRFLLKSFRGFTERFWPFVQTLILGFALYFVGNLVLLQIVALLTGDTVIANNEVVGGLLAQSRLVMLLSSVIAVPIVEEVLVRGVVFGTFHRVNRYLAYAASLLLFSFMHVWQFAGSLSVPALMANALAYIPASVALGWTYEKSGTLWCPIVLHAVINAIACGVTLAL